MKRIPPAVFLSVTLWAAGFNEAVSGAPCALGQSLQDSGALAPGAQIEREIAGGEAHSYRVTLASGDFLRALIEQRGIDVSARVIEPDGKKNLEAQNLNDTVRPERVLLIAETTGDHRLEVHGLGKADFRGRYVIKVERWRVATQADKDNVAAARAYVEAEKLFAQGTPDARRKALARYEQALPLYRAADDARGEADTLESLARIHYFSGDAKKSLDLLLQAMARYRALGDNHGETVTLQGAGLMLQMTGEYQKALEYYAQALPIQRADGDKWGEAGTLNNIGGVYMFMDEPQKAIDHYSRALPLQREVKNERGEAVTLNNLGEIRRLLGDYDEARDYFGRSLELRRATKDVRGEATTLNNLALVHSEQGDYPKALELYNLALPLRRGAGDLFGEAATLSNLGFVYYQQGEYQNAREHLDQALAIRLKINDRRGEAYSRHWLGATFAAMGEATAAMDHFNQALRLSRDLSDRIGEAETLKKIARLKSDQGDLSAARTQIEAALAIIENLRSKLAGQELRAAWLASRQGYYELHIDLLMRLHQSRPDEAHAAEALKANERSRARNLLDLLTEARVDIREGVDPALLERERSLNLQLNARERHRARLLVGRPNEEQLAVIEKELAIMLSEYRDTRAQIRQSSPRYAALTQPQPLDLKEIQRELDENTLLLEYALGDERSYLWAVSANSMTSHQLSNRAEIETGARRVYELLTARNQRISGESPKKRQERIAKADADYHRAASALSQTLLGPVAAQLRARRLVVVSDGALQYVPFGALPEPQSGRAGAAPALPLSVTPLIARYEVISLPSASAIAVLRQEMSGRRRAEKLVAALADPVFEKDDPRVKPSSGGQLTGAAKPTSLSETDTSNSGIERSAAETGVNRFLRLRFTRQEAEAITTLAPAASRLSALDFAASRVTLSGADISNYRMLHFATHGLLNSRHPELSGVVLSLVDESGQPQDGFLRLHEIYNLKLNADLVVLSGCRTALGKEVKGEGLVGLTRGFMYAGARRVMASLWSVEDKATAELMKRFYAGMLNDGLSASAALRSAQIEMRKQKRSQSPYFWAPFTLQGEWR